MLMLMLVIFLGRIVSSFGDKLFFPLEALSIRIIVIDFLCSVCEIPGNFMDYKELIPNFSIY